MALQRMDNVGIVVSDLPAAIAFFAALGMQLAGEARVEGPSVDRLVALDGVQTDLALMRTPDGHGQLELMKFQSPASVGTEPANAPVNALGIRRIMFAVDDLHDTVERLRTHGAALIGEVTQYEESHLLCYLRGPEGIILALAQQLR